MAIFGERLFLSFTIDSVFEFPVSLVWLPTSGTSTGSPTLAPFPSWDLHKEDNCDTIQMARGLQTDTDGRLWVIDNGNVFCPSKIWIFNLLNNDTIEHVHQFPDTVISGSRLLGEVVLEKTPDDYRAYITDSRSMNIVVYSRKSDKSWGTRQLYLGRSGFEGLHSVSLSELQNEGGTATLTTIGKWSGRPHRIIIDTANILYAAFYDKNFLSTWNILEPFSKKQFHQEL
ncbi:protein yellow-like [Cloeon dipterum]|uniref:protein yellow-like n=1 Tax=Cloeon dipterum TaxID=197152 RepID=UPI00321F8280